MLNGVDGKEYDAYMPQDVCECLVFEDNENHEQCSAVLSLSCAGCECLGTALLAIEDHDGRLSPCCAKTALFFCEVNGQVNFIGH